jgi:hypothetical protein
MGSFRVADRNAASSRQVQFHWVNIGDSKEVVMPFMQDGTYPPRNFATLGPSELQPPFIWISTLCKHTPSSLADTGQASDPILHFRILQSPVFLLNSRFSHFHDAINTFLRALFIPKLQSQFAEFLQYCYLNHLSIHYQFTCVGFQYGT